MTPVDETTAVHFSYRAQPAFAFMLLTEGPRTPSSLAEVLPWADLTQAAMPDALCSEIAMQDQTGALLVLARQEAAHRPKVRPVRHIGHVSDRNRRKPALSVVIPAIIQSFRFDVFLFVTSLALGRSSNPK